MSSGTKSLEGTPQQGGQPLFVRWRSAARSLSSSSSLQTILVWVLVLAAIPLSRLFSSHFPSKALIDSSIMLGLFLAIVAFGQGLVILSGGIDLSVPSAIALSAFFTGYLATAGLPTPLAIAGGLAIASIIGLINGLIVSRSSFPPFIVTLAVSTIAASILLGFSSGKPGQKAPVELVALFNGQLTFGGIAPSVVLLVVVLVGGYWLQSKTTFGRRIYAMGNSTVAAQIAGLRAKSITLLVYWAAGLAYGVAGVLLLGYGSGSDLNIGASWLLPSIAVVVVGGSAIVGGSGSYVGTVGAALLLTIVSIDISAAGFSEGVKQILYGAIILLALLLARFGGRRR
jgi:ribose transport system permease protein